MENAVEQLLKQVLKRKVTGKITFSKYENKIKKSIRLLLLQKITKTPNFDKSNVKIFITLINFKLLTGLIPHNITVSAAFNAREQINSSGGI